MNATPAPAPVQTSTESQKAAARPEAEVQVLKPGKRRIVGGTKFGKDGCGY